MSDTSANGSQVKGTDIPAAVKGRPQRVCPECRRTGRIVRGVCGTCYARYFKHGRLDELERKNKLTSRLCAAPECKNEVGNSGAKNLCFTHYQRLKVTGSLDETVQTMPDRERFLFHVKPRGSCGCGCACERWGAGISWNGYGHFYLDSKTQLAHRVAYVYAFGLIPDGLIVDHVRELGCVHTDCVRPGHLEAVTEAENAKRAVKNLEACSRGGQKGGAVKGEGLTFRQRFYSKLSTEPCTCGCTCRRWTGTIARKTEYGNFSVNGGTELAHRIAWELANGRPVPDGLVVDHVKALGCVHRDCVNPGHLEAVTRKVNAQRAQQDG